jgi:hypothetical protein
VLHTADAYHTESVGKLNSQLESGTRLEVGGAGRLLDLPAQALLACLRMKFMLADLSASAGQASSNGGQGLDAAWPRICSLCVPALHQLLTELSSR